jgi:regulator of nonsense transcripts 2
MRHQQQAEKEEQQRIKNLVLNLDLRDENDGPDGGDPLSYPLQPNPNKASRNILPARPSAVPPSYFSSASISSFAVSSSAAQFKSASASQNKAHSPQGPPLEKHAPNPYLQPRGVDKAGKGRASQRGRQLQVSDLDWYPGPSPSGGGGDDAANAAVVAGRGRGRANRGGSARGRG